MHNSNYTAEHYRTRLYYLSHTKHDCTLATCVFNRNTSLIGHKQRTVHCPLCKPLPRSTASCSQYLQQLSYACRQSIRNNWADVREIWYNGYFTKILKSSLVKTDIITDTSLDELRTFVICLCNAVNKHVLSSLAHRTIQTDCAVTLTL
jgi:hypothetical protein